MIKSKKTGILLPVFSLPSPYGTGGFGRECYNFIDFLHENNFPVWQILPLNFPDNVLSPYNPISSFAINPYFICPHELFKNNLLNKKDIGNIPEFDERKIEIKKMVLFKEKVFEKAFDNFEKGRNKKLMDGFNEFINKFKEIEEICLFIVLNKIFKTPFYLWEKKYRLYDEGRIRKFIGIYRKEVEKEKFLQFFAFRKWREIKIYANKKGIKIFGDIPFYVSLNSYEVWKYPEYFMLDKNLLPKYVGGVPPDMFSRNGQLWGNPCYNWEELEKNHFSLLVKRIEIAKKLYDYIRLDHFRGFEAVYIVKYGEKTARKGRWVKVPGKGFFKTLKNKFKNLNFLIAEDLGFITEEVIKLRKEFKIPGMKVFQFDYKNIRNWERNSVSYSSTHDSPTLKEWLSYLKDSEKKELLKVLEIDKEDYFSIFKKYLELSNSNWKIFQFQDLIGLGKEGRINIPGTKRGNWIFRIKDKEIEKAKRIITKII